MERVTFEWVAEQRALWELCADEYEFYERSGHDYPAATPTPPNRPLDYKTIYNMTDREPVWRVDKDDVVIS